MRPFRQEVEEEARDGIAEVFGVPRPLSSEMRKCAHTARRFRTHDADQVSILSER